jgi:hypothetical protein
VGWIPYRSDARLRVVAATPDTLEAARTEVKHSAMASARLQLRRMLRERAEAVTPVLRLGRD